MRHFLASIFTYALITSLAVGSILWAWTRSEQLVIAREADLEPSPVMVVDHPRDFAWRDFGKRTYVANCQNCHTADGSGRGMYPPIQNMNAHLRTPGGRDYLVDLVIYGLYTGTYGAPMPPMPELSDAEIAAVNNYILTTFAAPDATPATDSLYIPTDPAGRRGRNLDEWTMGERRPNVPTARELGRGVRVAIQNNAPAVPEGKDE